MSSSSHRVAGTDPNKEYSDRHEPHGTACLLVLDLDAGHAGRDELRSSLESCGHEVISAGSVVEALEILGSQTPTFRDRPDLLLLAPGRNPEGTRNPSGSTTTALKNLRATAHREGIPVLELLDTFEQSRDWLENVGSAQASDWMVRDGSPVELGSRVARLLAHRRSADVSSPATVDAPPIDTRFSSLLVHDLRTPLNVIGLSLRMVEQAVPRDDPDVQEDLRFIDENFKQIERMLTQISDYARLFEPGLELAPSPFDPRRMVEELLESRPPRNKAKPPTILLDIRDTCPREVDLDQGRVRMVLDYVLVNAAAAAQGEPIQLIFRGESAASPTAGSGTNGRTGRWIIEVTIRRSPPNSVHPVDLHSRSFERLCGTAAERRGMELAIAAHVTELFGGSARLESVPGQHTTVRLDWPV